MHLHIKTTIRKIIFLWKHPKYFYPSTNKNKFPESRASNLQINARLRGVKSDLKQRDFIHNLGALYPNGNAYSIKVYESFLKYNTNHLGNWSIDEPNHGTQQLEYEVIHKMINLYHADLEKIEGYITSGGTEGNLFAVWLSKSYLLSKVDIDKILLLRTPLTHYSIEKSAEICSIQQKIVPLNEDEWALDTKSLEKTILNEYHNGKKGFIIALTHGYTETGTNDDVEAITTVLNNILKKNKNIHFSMFMDASLGGLVTPFLTSDFKPFKSSFMHTFVTDFHKFMGVPYPSGLILYRSRFRKYIEKTIKYVDKKDNTISGSRPGAPAAATWAIIHKLGKNEFKKIAEKQLKLKDYFITELKSIFPTCEVINGKNSLSCGVVFNLFKNQKLPVSIERKYWLYANTASILFEKGKKRNIVIYKFFFLPHMSKRGVNDFINDLKSETH